MASDTPVPLYPHDCDACAFLGSVIGLSLGSIVSLADEMEHPYDLYVCPQYGLPTVVLRFGSAPEEYTSGAHLVRRLPEPARARAIEALDGLGESSA